MDWVVSSPDLVAEHTGSFAHFGRRIHLMPRDGGDPRTNGRTYEVAFPVDDVLPHPLRAATR